jgi:hypothetical protein
MVVERLSRPVTADRATRIPGLGPQGRAPRSVDMVQVNSRHLMIPRAHVVAIPHDVELSALRALAKRHRHSHYPVFGHSLDDIVGVLAVEAVLAAVPTLAATDRLVQALAHLPPPLFVGRATPAARVLAAMRQQACPLAVVLDDYGATAGIVTKEDILARIPGIAAWVFGDRADTSRGEERAPMDFDRLWTTPTPRYTPDDYWEIGRALAPLLRDAEREVGRDPTRVAAFIVAQVHPEGTLRRERSERMLRMLLDRVWPPAPGWASDWRDAEL